MFNFANDICTNCNEKDVIINDIENKEIHCSKCGMVYEDSNIVDEYEKRTFQTEDGEHRIERVGPPMNPANGNECGVKLLMKEKGKNNGIKRYSKPSKEQRNSIRIQNLLSQKQISQNMIEETKELYKKLAKNMNMQGRNIDYIIIAIFYYLSRKINASISFKDISKKFCVEDENQIKKAFNKIKSQIVEPIKNESEINDYGKDCIESFIGGDISRYELKKLAFKILENINQASILEGKSQKTIAGLSLFLSCKLLSDNLIDRIDFYQKFAKKNALNKAYEQIKNCIKNIIPQEFDDKINI